MESSGRLKVNEFLQVDGYQDIYAVGDCCNSKDIKLAFVAGMQGELLADNLAKKYNGQPQKPWQDGIYVNTSTGLPRNCRDKIP